MLYANRDFGVKTKVLKSGVRVSGIIVDGIINSDEIFLPTPDQAGQRIGGLRQDLTIGTTKTNRPRIDFRRSPDMYLILSSFLESKLGTYVSGKILAPPEQAINVISANWNYLGSGHEAVVKASPGDLFAIILKKPFDPSDFFRVAIYLVADGRVIEYIANDANSAYSSILSRAGALRDQLPGEIHLWEWSSIIKRYRDGEC